MKSILDPSFHYTPSHKTDIRKRFRYVIAAQKQAARDAARDAAKVVQIKEKRK